LLKEIHAVFAILLLLLTVWFDGVPVSCAVDTGAEMTVLRASTAAQIGTRSAPLSTARLQGIGGETGTVEAQLVYIPHIGTHELGWPGAVVAVVPDGALPVDCLLGLDLLSQQTVVIDWQRKRIGAAGVPLLPTRKVQQVENIIILEGVEGGSLWPLKKQ
jgi:hypothetical protein